MSLSLPPELVPLEALLAQRDVHAPYELQALADGHYHVTDAHGDAWTLRREETSIAPTLAQELAQALVAAGIVVAVAPFVAAPGCHWHLTRIANGMDPRACAHVGETLARAHVAARAIVGRANPYDGAWRKARAAQLSDRLGAESATLLATELRFQSLYRFTDLPQGLVFGDGARDPKRVDVRFVCRDVWLWDLAQAAEYCCGVDDTLGADRVEALLTAYHRLRPLTAIERGAWPVLLRRAALHRALQADDIFAADARAWAALTTRVHESKFIGKLWPGSRNSTIKGG